MAMKDLASPVLKEILRLKHAQPFAPFELRTSDGGRYLIAKGERLARSPSGRVISFYARGEPGHRTVNIADVVSVSPVPRRKAAQPRRLKGAASGVRR